MNDSQLHWCALLLLFAAWLLFTFPQSAHAQDLLKESDQATTGSADEGPGAALAFEKSFRGENNDWKPVPLKEMQRGNAKGTGPYFKEDLEE